MKIQTLPLLCLSGLLGCGEPLSNALFEEDAEFLAALPDRKLHRVPVEELTEAEARGGDLPWLLELSVGMGLTANFYLDTLLAWVEWVQEQPPTARGRDSRTWGPYEFEPGRFVKVDIARAGTTYRWDFQVSTAENASWSSFFTGEHLAGASVTEGLGSFRFDYSALTDRGIPLEDGPLTGALEISYDLREGRVVHVVVDAVSNGTETWNATFYFHHEPEGELRFEYRAPVDWNENGVLEDFEVVTRIQADRAGRGDALVIGEDTMGLPWHISQCWDSALDQTWYKDNYDVYPELGDESSCAYEDRDRVENL